MKGTFKIIIIGFLAVILINQDIRGQEEIQQTPTDDASAWEAIPYYAQGDLTFLAVEDQYYNGLTYSFIRFDISSIPDEAQILDAQLQLKCEDKNQSSVASSL